MSDGINMVLVQGELCWPEFKHVGANNTPLLKGKVRVATTDSRSGEERSSYIRIVAWSEFAEYLNSLEPRTHIRASGRIQEKSFEDREGQRRTVTDVVINGLEVVAQDSNSENSFLLQGELIWSDFKTVGERGTSLFRSKLKIPYQKPDGTPGTSYVRITAWDEYADGLGRLGDGANVKVSGHIQDRSWTDPKGNKRIYTDAIVTNYTGV